MVTAQDSLQQVEQQLASSTIASAELAWQQQGDMAAQLTSVATMSQHYSTAESALEQIAGLSVTLPQLPSLNQLAGKMASHIAARKEAASLWAQRYRDSQQALNQARQMFNGDLQGDDHEQKAQLKRALSLSASAIGLLVTNQEAVNLRDAISGRIRDIEQAEAVQLRKQERLDLAQTRFVALEQQVAELEAIQKRIGLQEENIESLQQQLADAAVEQRAPLWTAFDTLAEDQQQLAEMWTTVESAALEVLNLRRGEVAGNIDHRSQEILAELYYQSYQEAIADQDLVLVAAFREKVQRYDRGRYQLAASGLSRIRLTSDQRFNSSPLSGYKPDCRQQVM